MATAIAARLAGWLYTGELASPVTTGLHARKAGRGAASARPILNHVQRGFLMVFRPRPSGSSSTLKPVDLGSNRTL